MVRFCRLCSFILVVGLFVLMGTSSSHSQTPPDANTWKFWQYGGSGSDDQHAFTFGNCTNGTSYSDAWGWDLDWSGGPWTRGQVVRLPVDVEFIADTAHDYTNTACGNATVWQPHFRDLATGQEFWFNHLQHIDGTATNGWLQENHRYNAGTAIGVIGGSQCNEGYLFAGTNGDHGCIVTPDTGPPPCDSSFLPPSYNGTSSCQNENFGPGTPSQYQANPLCSGPPAGATVRYHVTDPTSLGNWGFSSSAVQWNWNQLSNYAVASYDWAYAPNLVQVNGQPDVWLRFNYPWGTYRRHINSPAVMSAWNFSWSSIQPIDAGTLNSYPVGADLPPTPFLASDSSGAVYVFDYPAVTKAVERIVQDPKSFGNWGFSWSNIAKVTSYSDTAWQQTQPFPYSPELINIGGGIFVLDNGVLRHVVDPTSFSNWGFSWSTVISWPNPNGYLMGADWPYRPTLVGGSSPAVFILDNIASPCSAASGSTGLTGTAIGGGQIAASWNLPPDNGGCPITAYAVYVYGNDGSTHILEPITNSVVISGLTPNTYYTFTVSAWNGSSWGAWSNWSPWVLAQ